MHAATIIRCVLSGSFHKDPFGLEKAYLELVTCGCQVLSPHRMQFIERDTEFVRDVAESNIDAKTIETHHLTSIRQANFLWVHSSEGYIGLSTALEIGYALAHSVPVFSTCEPQTEVFRQFIIVVPSVFEAVHQMTCRE
jgi:nucleoside 2-deoxyribosyltransferase